MKTPAACSGYWDDPAATEELYRGGWLHTGDLGYLADGRLYICGRIKDLIIVRGANFYPSDIEWAVGELPGVRRGNVAALAVTHEGEEQLAVVVECSFPCAQPMVGRHMTAQI